MDYTAKPNSLAFSNHEWHQYGLLSGKVTREYIAALPADDPLGEGNDYKEPSSSQILDLVDCLQEICLAHNRSVGEVAVAWVLCRKEYAYIASGA